MIDNPLRDVTYELRTMSRSQILVRLCVVGPAVLTAVVLAVVADAGGAAVAGVVLAGLLAAALPHGPMPLVAMLFVAGSWAAALDAVWHPAVLVVALSLLVMHTACALAATVPSAAPLPEGYWVLHGRRVGVVAAATTGLWGLAWVISGLTLPGGPAPPLLALTAVALGLAAHYALVTRRRPT